VIVAAHRKLAIPHVRKLPLDALAHDRQDHRKREKASQEGGAGDEVGGDGGFGDRHSEVNGKALGHCLSQGDGGGRPLVETGEILFCWGRQVGVIAWLAGKSSRVCKRWLSAVCPGAGFHTSTPHLANRAMIGKHPAMIIANLLKIF